MGDRGFNAGGFAYMDRVMCPRCGVIRPLGRDAIKRGDIACQNITKCDERVKSGHFLYRLKFLDEA